MPKPKRQLTPLIRKYLKVNEAAHAEAGGFGELKPVEPAARREGAPIAGDDQVYVMKYGTDYHTAWCRVVADKWDHSPRGLLGDPFGGCRGAGPAARNAPGPGRGLRGRPRRNPRRSPGLRPNPCRMQ